MDCRAGARFDKLAGVLLVSKRMMVLGSAVAESPSTTVIARAAKRRNRRT